MSKLTHKQLENRLAALHLASLELVKEISLDSLLERIAQLACDQVDASYGAVGVVDDTGKLVKFIPVQNPPESLTIQAGLPQELGMIGDLVKSTTSIRLSRVGSHSKQVGIPAGHPEVTSFLGVPMHIGDKPLGQIYLGDKKELPEFTEDDEKVIETLAAYASVAISNARLYQELTNRDTALTRRNADLALLNDLASTLASSLDIDEILEKALTRVMGNPQITVGEVFITDESGTSLQLMHHLGNFDGTLWVKDNFEFGEGPIGDTAELGLPQFSEIPGKFGKFLKQSVKEACLSQIACFPLSSRGVSVGVLCIATCQDKYLDEHETQLFTAIGAWVGTAIDNVRLYNQGRRLAILEERERIGMDLHDGVIQSIYAVGLTLEHARLLIADDPMQSKDRIDQAVDGLNHTIRDIRAYILDLRPRQMNEENLMDGLKRLIAEFKANSQAEITLEGPEEGYRSLPQVQALTLFHICQEALANIAKHAHASQCEGNPVEFLGPIAAWKCGMTAKDLIRQHTRMTLGHGLANINTRAKNASGDVEISSEPGEGTTILAWVPFREI